jgi:hypothetical protein
MRVKRISACLVAFTLMGQSLEAFAQASKHPSPSARVAKPKAKLAPPPVRMVAYDVRDLRYYPLRWARAHGMRDPAGDPLVMLPFTKLPKGANPTLVFTR